MCDTPAIEQHMFLNKCDQIFTPVSSVLWAEQSPGPQAPSSTVTWIDKKEAELALKYDSL